MYRIILISACFSALLTAGCSPNQHVYDELGKCKALFDEDCTLVTIPVSRSDEMQAIFKKWEPIK